MVSSAVGLSLRRQCELLGVSRSGYYYEPCPESPENLGLMRQLEELHLRHPIYGRTRLTAMLRRKGWRVNQKRIGRLMRVMDLEAIYCQPGTSAPQPGHEIHPYLLRKKAITEPDQVWCADITYIPLKSIVPEDYSLFSAASGLQMGTRSVCG